MEIKKSHQWEKTHRHALTIEEQSAFLNYIASNEQYKHWLPMFTLFLGTGCRVGEIVGLRWEDCDFKQRIALISTFPSGMVNLSFSIVTPPLTTCHSLK